MNRMIPVIFLAALAGCAHQNDTASAAAAAAAPPTTRAMLDRSGKESPIVHPLRAARSLAELEKAPLYTFNEAEVNVYLKHLHETVKDPIARVIHLARKNIGQPYAIYLLGEFPYETYDPDPMYCLEKSDCVTFVEHTYAMALSKDWPSFFRTLQRIRYKDGQVGLLTRNNESVADWEPNNSWLFEDVTDKLGDGHQTVPLHLFWQPSKFYGQFGIGKDLPDVTVNSTYIPASNVPNILKDLKAGDLIHIVRGNAKEQYVGHFTMVTDPTVPGVGLIQSHEPRVSEGTVMGFLKYNAKKTLGIKVLRPRANPGQVVAAAVK
jgi:hypothetical protein